MRPSEREINLSININLPSYLCPYADDKESVKVKGKTIQECLENLIKKHPRLKKMIFDEDGQLLTYVSIFAANEIVYSYQLDKSVKDGDEIHVLYILGGG